MKDKKINGPVEIYATHNLTKCNNNKKDVYIEMSCNRI